MIRSVLFTTAAILFVAVIPSSGSWHPPYYKLSIDTNEEARWEIQPDGQSGLTAALVGNSLELEETSLNGEVDIFRAQLKNETVETNIKKATFRILTATEERIITIEVDNGHFAWTLEIDDDKDGNFETQTLEACEHNECGGYGVPPEFFGPVKNEQLVVVTVDDDEEDADYVVMMGEGLQ